MSDPKISEAAEWITAACRSDCRRRIHATDHSVNGDWWSARVPGWLMCYGYGFASGVIVAFYTVLRSLP